MLFLAIFSLSGSDEKLQFSAEEARFLAAHPTIRMESTQNSFLLNSSPTKASMAASPLMSSPSLPSARAHLYL
jgi:hypothetical protein